MTVRSITTGSNPSPDTVRVEEKKFKPYSNFSREITFSAIVSNLLKLIANQFIDLGNFLNQKFVKIENPSTSDERVKAVAASALPAAPNVPATRQSPPPASPAVVSASPATATKAAAQTRQQDSIETALSNHLSDVLRAKQELHFFDIKQGDPIIEDPTTFMLPSALDEIRTSIIEGAWKKMPESKNQQEPTQEFKKEIKALIASSFYKQDYEIFTDKNDQEILNDIDKWAKRTGYASSVIVFALNYFSGDMLSPSYLESVMEEIGGPYLGYAAALALWGLTIQHMITQMGIEKPSMDQVKKFMKKLVNNPSSTLAQNGLAGLLGYLDRYYGCVKRVASYGINNVLGGRVKHWHPKINNEEKIYRFNKKTTERVQEASTKISRATFGLGVVSFGASLVYSAGSIAASALNTLGGLFGCDEVNTILATNITTATS